MKNTTKFAVKWLDTLTAWAFVVGLACWSYHLFMVQSPARFSKFGRGEIMGDFSGVLLVMVPYLMCMTLGLGTRGMLAGWPGERVCWRMLIWMHTRLLAPTLLSYYSAYTLYDNAEVLANASLSINIMSSSLVILIVCCCYFFSAEKYYQRESKKHQDKCCAPD